MASKGQGFTTASVEAIPQLDTADDPTPGLVLIYSRLHEQLPSALACAADTTTLGRELDNSLPIPEPAVSRYHARIDRRVDGCHISDVGSTNGTLVNGERVETCLLRDHDVVRIGDTVFRFAASGIYNYGAYRIDGSVVQSARPIRHNIEGPLLVGGFQMDVVLDRIDKIAGTGLAVVVTGESGTGKELVAQELHRRSRPGAPLQAINCAALPPNLIESELFGYRKGAFTGATQDKMGLLRAAHGGTLFLDEIGDMPLEAQVKLLRVLQEREVLPIGATTAEPVDVRVVCATHRDLDQYVAEGKFRGDLLARLREVHLRLPALRDRREDLYALVRHFLAARGQPAAAVSLPYMLGMSHYHWPYNVRELESAVKLSLALAKGAELDVAHLPEPVRQALSEHGRPSVAPPSQSAPISTTAPTENALRDLLTTHSGNVAAVGRSLGKERMQIHRWMKRYGIDVNEYRR